MGFRQKLNTLLHSFLMRLFIAPSILRLYRCNENDQEWMQADTHLLPYLYQNSAENAVAGVDGEDSIDVMAINSFLQYNIILSELYALNDSYVGPSYEELLLKEKDYFMSFGMY